MKPHNRFGSAGLLLLFLLFAAPLLRPDDWPNWRGPNHDGISSEKGLSFTWKSKPKVLWKRELGASFSSFAAVGERVYTCGTGGGKQKLICLGAVDGKPVWEIDIEGELQERQGGDGCRATPSVDNGLVYVLGAKGTLLCVKAKDGREVWRQKFSAAPTWFYSGSVLIEGDLAVVSPGGGDGSLAAFNKKTGSRVWKAGSDGAGYATPYPFTFEKTRYIACFSAKEILVVEADDGSVAWRSTWKTSYDVNSATPIYDDGNLFDSSGYGHGCALFRLRKSGGKLTVREVWKNQVIRSKFQTCVLYKGFLFGADEQALKCVQLKTGKLVWRKDRLGASGGRGSRTRHGTLTLADGHLIFLAENGQLLIAKASPSGFKPRAGAKLLSGRCWTAPALQDGRLYLRSLDTAVCIDLGK